MQQTNDFHLPNNKLIYFLIGLTALASGLSIFGSEAYGTYFLWLSLGLMLVFYLLGGKYWQSFLILTTALASLSVFQAGVLIGYRSWYYITIITAIFFSFKFGTRYFSIPGFKWWFWLLLLGIFHLFFIQSQDAFDYARGAVVQIAVGLAAFSIGYHASGSRDYHEEISQLSLLIMGVCTVALLVPIHIPGGEGARLGQGIVGMDSNGLGITALYAFIGMLFYMLGKNNKMKALIGFSVTPFLLIVLIRTASRQAIISTLIVLVLFTILTFRQRLKMTQLIIILSMLFTASFFISDPHVSYVEQRFSKAFDEGGKIDRLDHLITSFYMVAEHPLGLGGGGFKENFDEYKYKAGVDSVYKHTNPHTLFGMAIGDWGLPGIILLLGGFFALGRWIMKLKGLTFIVKGLAIFTYLLLANAGLSFPPIFMIFLGMRDSLRFGNQLSPSPIKVMGNYAEGRAKFQY